MVAFKNLLLSLGNLFAFLAKSKRWWLLPLIVLLLLCSALIVLGNVAGVGPFIYTLF